MLELCWTGHATPSLDTPQIQQVGTVTLGIYGGNTQAGARKNEDAALIWQDPGAGWTFAAILDAHGTSDSALLVLNALKAHESELRKALALPVDAAFAELEKHLIHALSEPAFLLACRRLQGETALLCCATKGPYLWWFSVGDYVAYLFHPELMRLGQHALNQRQFFEWVGKVSGFAERPFTYSSGVRALRQGRNDIVLVTDGLLEFGSRPFEDARQLATALGVGQEGPLHVLSAIAQAQASKGRDSATVICWRINNEHPAPMPSA